MTDVISIDKDVVIEVTQPTAPQAAKPPNIGLVEINQVIQRGSIWATGEGAPTLPGGQYGDLYLDVDTGDIYAWDGAAWNYTGTFAPSTLTPAEILAALITVDGAGSGLDADLLDGEQGTYYAKQSDMVTETNRNNTQDTQIAAHGDAITFNTDEILAHGAAITALENDKAPKASPVFTGNPTAPTPATSDNDTSIATTAFVKAQGYAPLASPALTGNPTAPTPTAGDNDTSIATTAFVQAAMTAGETAASLLAKLLTVDGAGSGLDADLLDGANSDAANTASTVVKRDGSGDIFARLIRQEYGVTSASCAFFIGQVALGAGADNYLRPMTIAQAAALLDSALVPVGRTISAGSGMTGGGDLSTNRTLSHADTSSQASVANSNPNFIQDVTVDTYGHVTGLASASVITAQGSASAGAVGTIALAVRTGGSAAYAFGATIAGSNLMTCNAGGSTAGGTTLSGTWRCLGTLASGSNEAVPWLRIS